MYRVTTPTHTFVLPIQTNTCKEIQVTYEQGELQIIKHYQDNNLPSGMTLDGKNVVIKLTQEETKGFSPKKDVKAQVRVLTDNNEAYASRAFNVSVQDVLNGEILS